MKLPGQIFPGVQTNTREGAQGEIKSSDNLAHTLEPVPPTDAPIPNAFDDIPINLGTALMHEPCPISLISSDSAISTRAEGQSRQ